MILGKLYITFILLLSFFVPLFAQKKEVGIPFITNFSPETYQAETQNWYITQDQEGILYFANWIGVLEYDGVHWKLISLPKVRCRSVAAHKDGKIYVGSDGDLGYLERDRRGKMQYYSLLSKIDPAYRGFNDVWDIHVMPEGVYFKTFSFIFFWDGKTMQVQKPLKRFHTSFSVHTRVWVKEDSIGLMASNAQGSFEALPNADFFVDKRIYGIVDFDEFRKLIFTRQHGAFLYTVATGQIQRFSTQADRFMLDNQVYRALRLPDGTIAVATLRGGILLLQKNGIIKEIIDEKIGLRTNTVWFSFLDHHKNLWLGLNNGICQVELNSPLRVFDRHLGVRSSVEYVCRFQHRMYVATDIGVGFLDKKQGEYYDHYTPLDSIKGQCFHLLSYRNHLLAATSEGIYEITPQNKIHTITTLSARKLMVSSTDSNWLWVGLRDGLGILELDRKKGTWKFLHQFKEIKGQVRTFYQETPTKIWVSTETSRILLVDISKGFADVKYRYFDAKDGLKNIGLNGIFASKKNFYVGLSSGFYTLNPKDSLFSKDTLIHTPTYPHLKERFSFTEDRNGNKWTWIERNMGVSMQLRDGKFSWTENKFRRIPKEYIFYIQPEGDSSLWVCAANALYYYDLHKGNAINSANFQARISQVEIIGKHISIPFLGHVPHLHYAHHDLRIQFSASHYVGNNEYQFKLEGYDENWSEWTEETQKDYTSLMEGTYTFRLRAKNLYGVFSPETSFSFRILPPWYRSFLAYWVYLLIFCGGVYGGIRYYTRRLKAHNEHLENLIKNRTLHIQKQKEEIEAHRDDIAQKNVILEMQKEEILAQRDDIEQKRLLLYEATQTIEEQNHWLKNINSELETQVEERTQELKNAYLDLLASNKELDHFIYRASHDIRGPIARLIGLCNILQMENTDPHLSLYLERLSGEANRTNVLLVKLLDAYEIKNVEIHLEKINLKEIVQECIEKMENLIEIPKTMQIQNFIAATLHVRADYALLKQIIYNLIENSCLYSGSENPYLHLQATSKQGKVYLQVMDNGIGILPEAKSRIFEMFYKGNDISKGFGLGLYAVQMACYKMGGDIRLVSSEPLKETIFEVKLHIWDSL